MGRGAFSSHSRYHLPPQKNGHGSLAKALVLEKKANGSWVNLNAPTRHQGGEWGTDARDGTRTRVSERLPSVHPATTSARCVWTQVYACVVVICSDQPVCDRCVVFGFVARWKDVFVIMINRNFMRFLMLREVTVDGRRRRGKKTLILLERRNQEVINSNVSNWIRV
jgi:hypothetical protein